jgi:hypothetical protein
MAASDHIRITATIRADQATILTDGRQRSGYIQAALDVLPLLGPWMRPGEPVGEALKRAVDAAREP